MHSSSAFEPATGTRERCIHDRFAMFSHSVCLTIESKASPSTWSNKVDQAMCILGKCEQGVLRIRGSQDFAIAEILHGCLSPL
jgi:hypothetical protein